MTQGLFIFRPASRSALQRSGSIARVLLVLALPFGIASCKPTENKPAPETQESSAGDVKAAKVVKDFGPTLLKIGTRYSISYNENHNSLSASRCGFVDLKGKVVIEPQWEKISDFSDGVAWLEQNGQPAWIDKTGQVFLPPPASRPELFHDGLARFEREGKWGYIDTKGTVVIQPEWEEAEDFSGGYAAVRRGGKWGGVDPTGRLVTPLGQYEGLYFVPQIGLWQMTVDKKAGYMDMAGRVVIKPQWDAVVDWSEGLGLVIRGGKAGFIDKTGKIVVPVESEQAGPFREGLAPVKRNGKWGFVDKSGKVVIEPQWEDALGFHRGLAAVQQNGKWGFIDKTGKVVIELRWEEVGDLGSELVLVKENKKFGFIDRTGRIVVEPQWDVAEYYWETQWDRWSRLGENEPIYWLVAREERRSSPPTVHALWLDSSGKQIWSSMGANTSENGAVSPNPPKP